MSSETFDITPSPRVLRMLGQIDFAAWQCLAELIDNSIDAFLEGRLGSKPLTINPQVKIELPLRSDLESGSGCLVVKDNGPGMTEETLRKSVRAGYSSNDPVEKLGLFGMGFNIATARLGKRTEVWTTTAESDEWIGVEIDFDKLEDSGAFHAPRLYRHKAREEIEQGDHGTEVRVSKLDASRVQSLTWGRGKNSTRRRLSKIYSRVIDEIGVRILYDGDLITPTRHCTWNPDRAVPTRDHGNVPAIIPIEEVLSDRRFCDVCWVWLESADHLCPSCSSLENVRDRNRRIKGWVGVQRYFDKQHFGIDLIRNGRVIEELDKSLFDWVNPETHERELEYPIDATHWGGRIVGELEVDFVRVSHQKDAFDKLDPQWQEVVDRVRGKPPFRPQIAKSRGYPPNISPLGKLFSAYRAGYGGLNNLVPGHPNGKGRNDSFIMELVHYFHNGHEDYQDDSKWYELVLLAEEARQGRSAGSREAAGTLPIGDDTGESGGRDTTPSSTTPDSSTGDTPTAVQADIFDTDAALSGEFKLDLLSGSPFQVVHAKRARSGFNDKPMLFTASGSNVEFRYDPNHSFFEESLESPLDCLIADLAHRFLLLSGQAQQDWPVAVIEREIRRKYFPETLTSVEMATEESKAILDDLREFLDAKLPEISPLRSTPIDEHTLGLIRTGVLESSLGDEQDVQKAISSGEFIRYVGTDFLVMAPRYWPQLIMDGQFVAVPYEHVSEPYRADSVAMVSDALRDAFWLVSDSGGQALSKDQRWRLRFARALSSVRLLTSWRR